MPSIGEVRRKNSQLMGIIDEKQMSIEELEQKVEELEERAKDLQHEVDSYKNSGNGRRTRSGQSRSPSVQASVEADT